MKGIVDRASAEEGHYITILDQKFSGPGEKASRARDDTPNLMNHYSLHRGDVRYGVLGMGVDAGQPNHGTEAPGHETLPWVDDVEVLFLACQQPIRRL